MMNKTFENAENILFAAFSQTNFVDEESDENEKSSRSNPKMTVMTGIVNSKDFTVKGWR